MKKYFFGIIAIAMSISLSAFKAPMSTLTYLLIIDPTSSDIVSDPSNWEGPGGGGTVFGRCDVPPEEVACSLKMQSTTMSKYSNTASGSPKLNTMAYALANTASDARFLIIVETYVGPRYKIVNILPKKLVYNFVTQQYDVVADANVVVAKQQNLSAGVDIAYWNARY
jgi:hypothetical protein